jgi:hypothetical protein
VVLVNEAAEDATTFDAVNGIAGDSWTWCFELEAAVWPFPVVVLDVGIEYVLQLAMRENQQAIETLGSGRFYPALGIGIRTWRSHWSAIVSIPSDRRTSSNAAVNLVSRSLIKKRVVHFASWSSQARFRAI